MHFFDTYVLVSGVAQFVVAVLCNILCNFDNFI